MKKFLAIIITFCLLLMPISACNDENDIKTIEVNEVTHSVFYAPLYVAMENGFFLEEGYKINLTNGGGSDASMTAVLSKTADIGLMGPETVIYVFNQGKKDSPKVFGQLTMTDGAFLVSRKEEPDFKWEDLKNKEILAGRKGGMPAMTFEYILNQLNIYDGVNVKLNYDVQFNLMTSAFISGTADYCTVFEPTASEYEKEGIWHIVASVGKQGGEIPYTSFIALQSFIKDNPNVIKSFLKALKKAHEFIDTKSNKEIAESIVKQFPSTTINSLETSIKNYKEINAWKKDMILTESLLDKMQNIMVNAKELDKRVQLNDIADNSFAKEIFG